MGREDPQLKLRLTEGMKDRITAAARQNNRSVNAEIVARLEGSFSSSISGLPADMLLLRDALSAERAKSTVLRENFKILASQLAGPAGENSDVVVSVMTALRILGSKVPE
ncbi:Arc family DNA-binding protein [Ancylobacter oerskovii]|uniref:Arc family DNA-binding protein n=1 Tax=Ancylobacter oerskovii TaxID=459519 RepID=A0ABW4YRE8_9HYPH|nr:Arc family DNA-binding protein [Ancylobacter oerskovii]MBS7545715.1 Arc family DNA-binding protein [Ancylobacter oerskovii]